MEKNHFVSPVIASSGMLGFIGEGYKYHKVLKFLLPFLFSLRWITFQCKTVVAFEREGNLPLSKEDGITPLEFYPKCIYADIWQGVGVNNVSLSGPGITAILKKRIWHKMKGEIHLSFMLTGETMEERLQEAYHILDTLKPELKHFQANKIFLHWNISCPNTGHNAQAAFLETFTQEYKILAQLKLPIMLKIGWNFPVDVALELQSWSMIYGFDAINTIPFNDLPEDTKKKYFKKDIFYASDGEPREDYVSPLDKVQGYLPIKGRGGVSGNPIRPYALQWIREARAAGVTLPIIGGGGILWPWHVLAFKKAGATAVSPGSICFLRPFNLLMTTLYAKIIFRSH